MAGSTVHPEKATCMFQIALRPSLQNDLDQVYEKMHYQNTYYQIELTNVECKKMMFYNTCSKLSSRKELHAFRKKEKNCMHRSLLRF